MHDERMAAIKARLASGVEAFNRADLDAATAHLTKDCRYQIAREHPESRLCVGREEIRRYQEEWFDQLDEIRFDVDDIAVRWPYGLVLGRIRGRGGASGVGLSVDLGLLYRLNDRVEAVEVEEFLDLSRARQRFDALATATPTD